MTCFFLGAGIPPRLIHFFHLSRIVLASSSFTSLVGKKKKVHSTYYIDGVGRLDFSFDLYSTERDLIAAIPLYNDLKTGFRDTIRGKGVTVCRKSERNVCTWKDVVTTLGIE